MRLSTASVPEGSGGSWCGRGDTGLAGRGSSHDACTCSQAERQRVAVQPVVVCVSECVRTRWALIEGDRKEEGCEINRTGRL